MALNGLKLVTQEGDMGIPKGCRQVEGQSLFIRESTRLHPQPFQQMTYPVGEWVIVPDNGAYVAMTASGIHCRLRRDEVLLAQFECEGPTGAAAPEGVVCYRRVMRLPEVDIEWVGTLSVPMRAFVAKYGKDRHRDALVKDPDSAVRCAVARYGNNRQRWALVRDPEWNVRRAMGECGDGEIENAALFSIDSMALRARTWFKRTLLGKVEKEEIETCPFLG